MNCHKFWLQIAIYIKFDIRLVIGYDKNSGCRQTTDFSESAAGAENRPHRRAKYGGYGSEQGAGVLLRPQDPQ